MKRSHVIVVVMGVVALTWATGVQAASNIVLPRPGQVGLGVQGQFGSLLEGGDYGDLFESGPGVAVRMRYRMRYERALGITFESQTFDARETSAADTAADKLTLIMSGIEVYQLFGTRTRTTRMVSVGLGLAQASAKLNSGETVFPDDGFYVNAGAGLERFVYRSWAIDLSTRYFAIFQHGKTNHDFQVAAGLVFYASY
jgi:hypothetical protein